MIWNAFVSGTHESLSPFSLRKLGWRKLETPRRSEAYVVLLDSSSNEQLMMAGLLANSIMQYDSSRPRIAFTQRSPHGRATLREQAWSVRSAPSEKCESGIASLLSPLAQLFESGFERILILSPHAVIRKDIRRWFDESSSFRIGMGAGALVLRSDVDDILRLSESPCSAERAVRWKRSIFNGDRATGIDAAAPIVMLESPTCRMSSLIIGGAAHSPQARSELHGCAYDDRTIKYCKTLLAISGRASDLVV